MKERFLNFIKWFFVILGILFLIQILLLSGIFIGFNSAKEPNIKIENTNLKEIQPIIDYVEKYRNENNKYPKSVDIKLKKGNYKYSTTENSNCFQVIYEYKDIKKDYGMCKINDNNSNIKTETLTQSTK